MNPELCERCDECDSIRFRIKMMERAIEELKQEIDDCDSQDENDVGGLNGKLEELSKAAGFSGDLAGRADTDGDTTLH